jgi:hypothetical protein
MSSRAIGSRIRLYLVLLCLLPGIVGGTLLPRSAAAIQDEGAVPTATPAPGVDANRGSTLPPMIFSDDFEAYGDSSRWNSGQRFPVQSNTVANGLFAARLTNAGDQPAYGRKTLDQPHDLLYVRIRFYVFNVGSRPTTLINLRPSSTTESIVAIRLDQTGVISYVTGATGITSESPVLAAPGMWHELQVMADTKAESNNIRIWLDQAEMTSLRHDAFLGDDSIRKIDLGDNSSGQYSDIAFDDIAVDDSFIASNRPADPVPGVLTVRTLPAWSGITFDLDGEEFTTNEQGVATIKVARWSTDLRSRIVVRDSNQANGAVTSFTGWRRWASSRSTDVSAAFRVSQPVTFSFVDLAGKTVDPTMIDELTIKSSSGVIETLTGSQLSQPTLITVSSVVPSPSGISSEPTDYVVDQVLIDGSNVVNRAQQRSPFATSRHWTITLLFYGVTFQATDALFGTPLGKELVVKAADGSEQRLALDENGEAVIPRLARGEYSVAVIGAGYSPPRPIMVSRDQVVSLEVISLLDVALVLGVMGSTVIGLILIGRPFIVTRPVRWVVGILLPIDWKGLRR